MKGAALRLQFSCLHLCLKILFLQGGREIPERVVEVEVRSKPENWSNKILPYPRDPGRY